MIDSKNKLSAHWRIEGDGLFAGDYLGCAVVGILRLIVFGPEDGLIFFKQLLKVGKHKLIIDGVRLA